MEIRLGQNLDGEHAWQPANQLNVTTTGPLGLLNLLETQLGLLQIYPTGAERIVQYLECLKLCDGPSRFYHHSLTTDELGTAATLLSWRDSWYLHGWNVGLGQANSNRLKDVQAVEEVTAGRLAPSIGERLQVIIDALAIRKPAISEIQLCEPLTNFPLRWQNVLRLLPIHGICLSDASAPPTTLLGRLQLALAAFSKGHAFDKIAWKEDGSVRFVRAETEILAARWLAESMHGPRSGKDLDCRGARSQYS